MDISSLNSAYADIYSAQKNQTAAKVEEVLDGDMSQKTDDELMDACKEFEAYFVEQMFKEMMKTVPKSEETTSYGSNLTEYMKDNLLQEIAADSTEGNSLGLAQMLYEQMKRNYDL